MALAATLSSRRGLTSSPYMTRTRQSEAMYHEASVPMSSIVASLWIEMRFASGFFSVYLISYS